MMFIVSPIRSPCEEQDRLGCLTTLSPNRVCLRAGQGLSRWPVPGFAHLGINRPATTTNRSTDPALV